MHDKVRFNCPKCNEVNVISVVMRNAYGSRVYGPDIISAEVIVRSVSTIIIPARLASTRLPRKLLLRETGKSLLQHTYEAAGRAMLPSGIIVAADDEEIAREVRSFGGQVVLTDPSLPSGTDRVAAVARDLPDVDIVVNLQGDEPELSGEAIDAAVRLLDKRPDAVMATLATPIRNREQLEDPACVKVVFDCEGRALYFSRSVIPHPRRWDDRLLEKLPRSTEAWGPDAPSPTPHRGASYSFYQHVGLYAYRREFLLELWETFPSRLEQIEKLEQLRVLEAGHAILVATIDEPTVGIDTPADYRAFVERCRGG